jgi:hypothetical protein
MFGTAGFAGAVSTSSAKAALAEIITQANPIATARKVGPCDGR